MPLEAALRRLRVETPGVHVLRPTGGGDVPGARARACGGGGGGPPRDGGSRTGSRVGPRGVGGSTGRSGWGGDRGSSALPAAPRAHSGRPASAPLSCALSLSLPLSPDPLRPGGCPVPSAPHALPFQPLPSPFCSQDPGRCRRALGPSGQTQTLCLCAPRGRPESQGSLATGRRTVSGDRVCRLSLLHVTGPRPQTINFQKTLRGPRARSQGKPR